jgi:hypothetical protein
MPTKQLEEVTFLPVTQAFKPQRMIKIRSGHDMSGWLNDDVETRKRWAMAGGKEYAIDEDKARDYIAKGYATPVGWDPELTDAEIEAAQSKRTIVDLGDASDG